MVFIPTKLLIFVIFFGLVSGQKKVIIVKADVQINTTYLERNEFIISKNGTSVDVELIIKENYERDPWVSVTLAKRDVKSRSYVSIFFYDLDVCRFLGRKNHNDKLSWIYIWFDNYWKQGNMPRYCPIVKGSYYWKGVRFDRASVPSFLLSGRYRTIVKTYFKPDPQLYEPYVSVANVTIYAVLK